MITLSYGYKKPQTGDKGSIWFPALEDDIEQLNDHNHDGLNSEKLTAASITGVGQTITAASWVSLGGGNFRQLVTTPANVNFDDYARNFVINNGSQAGHQIYPSVEKVSNTTYYVYINDNTIDLKILYLV